MHCTSNTLANTITMPSNAVPAITRLETRGFIQRVANAQDARSLLVQLSPEGLALINRAVEVHVENERQLLSGMQAQALAELDAHLSTLLLTLEESH